MASTHSSATAQAIAPEVDGRRAAATAAPSTPQEIAHVLAEAAATGQAVLPFGGGSQLMLGNLPERMDVALSTRGLNRVLHYEPTDLTLSVEAGIGFADLQRLLAEHGQTLPVEIADADRATVGGMIATALAGPRRFGSGSLRDLLIGISVAYPSGVVGKAGGLVVKNVSGFDLMRLHLGALGTLGVVVSANFKVLPLARDEATLLGEPVPLRDALAVAASVRWDRSRPVAIEVVREPAGWRTAVRIEGRPGSVAHAAAALQGRFGGGLLLAQESRAWWHDRVQAESLIRSDSSVLIRCGAAAAQVAELTEGLVSVLLHADLSPEFFSISAGLGVCTFRLRELHGSPADLGTLQTALLDVAGSVTVLSAPPDGKTGIDVWGRVPETIAVMRALKQEFDPARVLSPGRFVDHI